MILNPISDPTSIFRLTFQPFISFKSVAIMICNVIILRLTIQTDRHISVLSRLFKKVLPEPTIGEKLTA
jgi:hypothetical protein